MKPHCVSRWFNVEERLKNVLRQPNLAFIFRLEFTISIGEAISWGCILSNHRAVELILSFIAMNCMNSMHYSAPNANLAYRDFHWKVKRLFIVVPNHHIDCSFILWPVPTYLSSVDCCIIKITNVYLVCLTFFSAGHHYHIAIRLMTWYWNLEP